MTQAIRRLWGEEKNRPVYEQILGRELAQEMAARLDGSKPWTRRKSDDEEMEDRFLCNVTRRCQTAIHLIRMLADRPDNIDYETGLMALMMASSDNVLREVGVVFKEHDLPAIQRRGVIEFCDMIEQIHVQQHSHDGLSMLAISIG